MQIKDILRLKKINQQVGLCIFEKLKNLPKNVTIKQKGNILSIAYGKMQTRINKKYLVNTYDAMLRLSKAEELNTFRIENLSIHKLDYGLTYSKINKNSYSKHRKEIVEMFKANGVILI